MSFELTVKCKIKDLGAFKQACRANNISLVKQNSREYVLLDEEANHRNTANMIRSKEGHWEVTVDHDVNYSSLSRRLGPGMPILFRHYAENVVRKACAQDNHTIQDREVLSDGRIRLRAVNY